MQLLTYQENMVWLYVRLTSSSCEIFCEKVDLDIMSFDPVGSIQTLYEMIAVEIDCFREINSRKWRPRVKTPTRQ